MSMFVRRESFKEYLQYYPITSGLIAINLVMLVIMDIYGSSEDAVTLLRFGALYDLSGVIAPEWWRYLTPIVLHSGWSHLLFNTFGLLVFAPPLERMLGMWRYAAYYVVCGVAGNAASALFHQDYFISVGASGAIYGIYAAYLYLAIFRKDMMDDSSRKTIQTIIIIGFIYSVAPFGNIDLWAHLGGFVGGFVTVSLIVLTIRRRHMKYEDEQD